MTTLTIAEACRRLRMDPRTFRRGWDGIFTLHKSRNGRVVLAKDEVEHAAQFAGDRQRMVNAVLAMRRDFGRITFTPGATT